MGAVGGVVAGELASSNDDLTSYADLYVVGAPARLLERAGGAERLADAPFEAAREAEGLDLEGEAARCGAVGGGTPRCDNIDVTPRCDC